MIDTAVFLKSQLKSTMALYLRIAAIGVVCGIIASIVIAFAPTSAHIVGSAIVIFAIGCGVYTAAPKSAEQFLNNILARWNRVASKGVLSSGHDEKSFQVLEALIAKQSADLQSLYVRSSEAQTHLARQLREVATQIQLHLGRSEEREAQLARLIEVSIRSLPEVQTTLVELTLQMKRFSAAHEEFNAILQAEKAERKEEKNKLRLLGAPEGLSHRASGPTALFEKESVSELLPPGLVVISASAGTGKLRLFVSHAREGEEQSASQSGRPMFTIDFGDSPPAKASSRGRNVRIYSDPSLGPLTYDHMLAASSILEVTWPSMHRTGVPIFEETTEIWKEELTRNPEVVRSWLRFAIAWMSYQNPERFAALMRETMWTIWKQR